MAVTDPLQNNLSIVRGNRADLILTLKADGVPVPNLADAIAARFVAINGEKAVIIDKALGDMTINDPEVGNVRIPLSSADTDIATGRYDIAFQATWGALDVLEWNFTSALIILEGVIVP